MTTLRTLEQVRAAGRADGEADPPITQDQADYLAAVLATCAPRKADAA